MFDSALREFEEDATHIFLMKVVQGFLRRTNIGHSEDSGPAFICIGRNI